MTRFGDAEWHRRPQQGVLLVQDMQSVESGRLSAAGRWASGIGSGRRVGVGVVVEVDQGASQESAANGGGDRTPARRTSFVRRGAGAFRAFARDPLCSPTRWAQVLVSGFQQP